ncbi:MAG: hypothetical protein J0J04_07875 [Microbacterium sp.]|uniref:hypothetical protein n=1 Tax=Microbacterium sp. TaxID=51671 RepID=UPI001ACFD6FF|nr:hypothetical protein [Microbacterium sp.]MBN9214717.1 hypothetical protein [Microbacterium sp.]
MRTRTAGWCDADFAHPGRISVGDRVEVVTYFPSDENVRDFGALALHRYRRCQWCVDRDEAERARRADAPEPAELAAPCM